MTRLKQVGFGININSTIDEETAILLAQEFGVELEVKTEIAAEAQLISELTESRKAVGEDRLAKRAPGNSLRDQREAGRDPAELLRALARGYGHEVGDDPDVVEAVARKLDWSRMPFSGVAVSDL